MDLVKNNNNKIYITEDRSVCVHLRIGNHLFINKTEENTIEIIHWTKGVLRFFFAGTRKETDLGADEWIIIPNEDKGFLDTHSIKNGVDKMNISADSAGNKNKTFKFKLKN